jgi:uncharacterized protein YfkK (UPF0435 family)
MTIKELVDKLKEVNDDVFDSTEVFIVHGKDVRELKGIIIDKSSFTITNKLTIQFKV